MAYTAQITPDDQNRRLDRILRKAFPSLPLSAIHKMIRKGQVHIDGKPVSASFKPQAGSVLEIPALDIALKESTAPRQHKERGIPLSILFENEALLCINKKRGIPVHGEKSVDEAVLAYLKPKLPPSLSFKPGPLHRLDQGTSGILFFSKNIRGAQAFSEGLREHRFAKWYLAVLQGHVTEAAQWDDVILRNREQGLSHIDKDAMEGKRATTTVYPILHNRDSHTAATLVCIKLGTGRTHQIRVQAAHHGFPLLGDIKYGAKKQPFPWLLHAYEMDGLETLHLSLPAALRAPLWPDQLALLQRLFPEKEQHLFFQRLEQTPPLLSLLDAIIN
ncbi:MAG: RluA family pseudouridine synthase [Treponema sp.]|nr:RluA family pseudouridine synthase [Treponema sp.]